MTHLIGMYVISDAAALNQCLSDLLDLLPPIGETTHWKIPTNALTDSLIATHSHPKTSSN